MEFSIFYSATNKKVAGKKDKQLTTVTLSKNQFFKRYCWTLAKKEVVSWVVCTCSFEIGFEHALENKNQLVTLLNLKKTEIKNDDQWAIRIIYCILFTPRSSSFLPNFWFQFLTIHT